MIRIFLGNVGSGKTISAVKELVDTKDNPYKLPTFSNIITKKKGKYGLPKNFAIKRDMLIKKEVVRIKKDGTEEFKLSFNKEFWVKQRDEHNGFNIVLDEAHTLIDARRFMSKQNKIMNDFMALIRKIAQNPNNDATLTLISQLDNRIDLTARELCTEVRYHIGLYDKVCTKCGAYWSEHSNMSDYQKLKQCGNCSAYTLRKTNHRLIVHFFNNIKEYQNWKYSGISSMRKTIKITNMEHYFPYYDTYQLDDLISEED